MKMKKCINCGREIPADYGFCKYCGARQPVQAPTDSISNPSQNLNVAKSQASVAEQKEFRVTNDNDANASLGASLAQSKASQAEQEVSKLASYSAKQSTAMSKAQGAISEANAKKQAINQQRLAQEKQADQRQQTDRDKQANLKKQSPKYQKRHAIFHEIYAFILPIVGFFIGAGITDGGVKNGMFGVVATAICSIIGIYFAITGMKRFKKTSFVMMAWCVIVVLMMFVAVNG